MLSIIGIVSFWVISFLANIISWTFDLFTKAALCSRRIWKCINYLKMLAPTSGKQTLNFITCIFIFRILYALFLVIFRAGWPNCLKNVHFCCPLTFEDFFSIFQHSTDKEQLRRCLNECQNMRFVFLKCGIDQISET